MTARDRPDGDYVHTCDVCHLRFNGYKTDRACMECHKSLCAVSTVPSYPVVASCPCQAPRLCIQCGASSPCGLLPPGAEPGDKPICAMEPETYAELVERVKAAYGAAGVLRADKAEALTALSGMVRLFACDNGQPFAEHTETIAAVRVLAKAGMLEIVRDGADEIAGGWLECEWVEEGGTT